MTDAVLSIDGLNITYARAEVPAISELNIKVDEGEFVAVMGANGAGKSTLSLASVGIIPAYHSVTMSGNVQVLDANTRDTTVEEIAKRGAGIIFQQPDMQLVSVNVELEVAFAMENHQFEREEMRKRITRALAAVRLSGFEKRPPEQLSGGQKQSVCIAVALALEPRLIVLDEPTSQLDPIGSEMVFSALREINQKHNIAILIMEHKAELLARYADRIIVLDEGKQVYEGTPEEVFSHSEDLIQRGVPVPQVSELAARMQKELNIPFGAYPVDEHKMASRCIELLGGSVHG
jgi:energy-coupling factor transporter ATP-binding protein EcfA2